MRLAPRRLSTAPARRADLEPRLRWAGFTASLAPETLRADGDARWELFAHVRAGGLRRRRAVFALDGPSLPRTVDLPAGGDMLMRATVGADGRAVVTLTSRFVRIDSHRRIGSDVLELSGRARLASPAPLRVGAVAAPLVLTGSAFRAQVSLAALEGDAVLSVEGAALSLAEHLDGAAWRAGGRDMALERTADGGGRLLVGRAAQAGATERASNVPVTANRM
jgi:hypothetical protein